MQGANKDKKKGRSAGGMLTGIRKALTVKNIEKEKRDMINGIINGNRNRRRKLENYIGI